MKKSIVLAFMLFISTACTSTQPSGPLIPASSSPIPRNLMTSPSSHFTQPSIVQTAVEPTPEHTATRTPGPSAVERIFFADTNDKDSASQTEIYSVDTDGTHLVNLTNTPDQETSFAYSLKSEKLVFARWKSVDFFLITMDLDGSNKLELLKSSDMIDLPAWFPDGQKITFVKTPLSSGKQYLCVTDLNGSSLCPVENPGLEMEGGPFTIWSPDSKQIVFSKYTNEAKNHQEIFVADTTNSKISQLTDSPTITSSNPLWSPIGQQIVFTRQENFADDLYLINADGSGLTRLTHDGQSKLDYAWSPDGSRIVYINSDPISRSSSKLVILDLSTNSATTVMQGATDLRMPVWSPDGKQLAFGSLHKTQNNVNCDLFVVNQDGSNPLKIVNLRGGPPGFIWSPDGKKIAFGEDEDGTGSGLGIINADGTGLSNLPVSPLAYTNLHLALFWSK